MNWANEFIPLEQANDWVRSFSPAAILGFHDIPIGFEPDLEDAREWRRYMLANKMTQMQAQANAKKKAGTLTRKVAADKKAASERTLYSGPLYKFPALSMTPDEMRLAGVAEQYITAVEKMGYKYYTPKQLVKLFKFQKNKDGDYYPLAEYEDPATMTNPYTGKVERVAEYIHQTLPDGTEIMPWLGEPITVPSKYSGKPITIGQYWFNGANRWKAHTLYDDIRVDLIQLTTVEVALSGAIMGSAIDKAMTPVPKAYKTPLKIRTRAWKPGGHKSLQKFQSQMQKRGWTPKQIDEAMAGKQRLPATNKVNPGNTATRYVHPTTGRSVVVDDATGEVLHVGGDGFKY